MLSIARSAVLAFALCVTALPIATPSVAGTPPASFSRSVQPLDTVARVEMPARNNEALLQAALDTEAAARGGVPYVFADAINTKLTLEDGTWEPLDDGTWLWRLVITSPGAVSLSALIEPFELSEHDQFWGFSTSDGQSIGPYAAENRSLFGRLWLPPLKSEEIVLELHTPNRDSSSKLSITRVHHAFRDHMTRGGQGSCNIDTVCPQGGPWRNESRSVGHYIATGVAGCTGQLMNNTARDGRYLFLTAHHCRVRQNNADSVLIFWQDDAPLCGAPNDTGNPVTQSDGATFLAGHESSDFSLLELNAPPTSAANVYFSGWDIRATPPASTFAIHHPSGGEKSLAFDEEPPTSRVDVIFQGGLVVSELWQTIWGAGNGTTEGGSSGSCLRDELTGRCIGTLSGGSASCGAPNGADFFAKLSRSWAGGGTPATRLADWLDPLNTGELSIEGIDPQGAGLGCVETDTSACVSDSRFRVELAWQAANGSGGAGQVFQGFNSNNSVLFHFGNPNNLEILAKVINACTSASNRFWVFAGGSTNVEFTLTVTDTESGQVKTYFNPLGNPADAITDTSAFDTCPQ